MARVILMRIQVGMEGMGRIVRIRVGIMIRVRIRMMGHMLMRGKQSHMVLEALPLSPLLGLLRPCLMIMGDQ